MNSDRRKALRIAVYLHCAGVAPVLGGKATGSSWQRCSLSTDIRPAAIKAGITKRIGLHTFRHTYSTLLQANENDVKVVQELMRHANVTTIMNVYTQAITSKKRQAQSRVVDVLFGRKGKAAAQAEIGNQCPFDVPRPEAACG